MIEKMDLERMMMRTSLQGMQWSSGLHHAVSAVPQNAFSSNFQPDLQNCNLLCAQKRCTSEVWYSWKGMPFRNHEGCMVKPTALFALPCKKDIVESCCMHCIKSSPLAILCCLFCAALR
jgi:hypothetical protein